MRGKAPRRSVLERGGLGPANRGSSCRPGLQPRSLTPTPQMQVGTITVPTAEPLTAPPSPASSTGEGECGHDYFPSDLGATWEVAGTNGMLGDYQNTATVTVSSDDGFIVTTEFIDGSGTFSLAYSCTDEGLTLLDPLGQSSSAVATGPRRFGDGDDARPHRPYAPG